MRHSGKTPNCIDKLTIAVKIAGKGVFQMVGIKAYMVDQSETVQ